MQYKIKDWEVNAFNKRWCKDRKYELKDWKDNACNKDSGVNVPTEGNGKCLIICMLYNSAKVIASNEAGHQHIG